MPSVLIVEDERDIAGILFDHFESMGWVPDYASNGVQAVNFAQKNDYDLIVLDVMLPKMNGMQVCDTLRQSGVCIPILMLTAIGDRTNVIKGLKVGADDYVSKPFDLDVLQARCDALIRRNNRSMAGETVQYSDIVVNLKTREAKRQDVTLNLNPTTFSLLVVLCRHAPNPVSRRELALELWPDGSLNEGALRSHIYQLRSQVDSPFSGDLIKTVPKLGYQLLEACNEH